MTEVIESNVIDRDFINHKVTEMLKLSGELDKDIMSTNSIHYDLQTLHNKLSRKLHDEEVKLKKLKASRKRYYSGQMPGEYYQKHPLNFKVNAKDINKYIDNDELVIGQSANVDEVEACLKIVEDGKKRLGYRTNDIKTIIEYRKFLSGVN